MNSCAFSQPLHAGRQTRSRGRHSMEHYRSRLFSSLRSARSRDDEDLVTVTKTVPLFPTFLTCEQGAADVLRSTATIAQPHACPVPRFGLACRMEQVSKLRGKFQHHQVPTHCHPGVNKAVFGILNGSGFFFVKVGPSRSLESSWCVFCSAALCRQLNRG